MKPDRKDMSRLVRAAAPRADAGMDTAAVRDLMWRAAGLFRTHDTLEDAVARLDGAWAEARRAVAGTPTGDAWRHFNLVTVARMITVAALRREESRGGHFRADFPARDDRHWQLHAVDRSAADDSSAWPGSA
jgi:succinate dehydrogenase/fumarate reductase flavoprotein subunit